MPGLVSSGSTPRVWSSFLSPVHISLVVEHPDVVLVQVVSVGEEQIELVLPGLGLGVPTRLEIVEAVTDAVTDGRVEHHEAVASLLAENELVTETRRRVAICSPVHLEVLDGLWRRVEAILHFLTEERQTLL